jgi:hypothetical protein
MRFGSPVICQQYFVSRNGFVLGLSRCGNAARVGAETNLQHCRNQLHFLQTRLAAGIAMGGSLQGHAVYLSVFAPQ